MSVAPFNTPTQLSVAFGARSLSARRWADEKDDAVPVCQAIVPATKTREEEADVARIAIRYCAY